MPAAPGALRRGALLLLGVLGGCFGALAVEAGPGVYRADLGVGTSADVRGRIPGFMLTRGYEIRTSAPGSGLLLETEWREREPDAEERARGIELARTRIRIESRPRVRRPVMSSATLERVRFHAEVQGWRNGGWEAIALSAEAARRLREVAAALRTELQARSRRF